MTNQEPATPEASQEVNVVTNTAPVAENTDKQEPKGDGLPKGVKERLYKQTSKIRELENKLKELEAQKAQVANRTEPTDVNFLDDPDKYLAHKEKAISERIKAEIRAEQENATRQQRANEAAKFLITHPDINGDLDAVAEMEETINSNLYFQKLASVDPMIAAEKVLEKYLSDKGITPTRKSAATTEQKASSSSKTHSGSTPVTGKTAETIKKEIASLKKSDPDYEKKFMALLEAAQKL